MTKLINLKNETDLINIQTAFYKKAQENIKDNKKQKFKGLMELISSEVTIMTAIHNMKSNNGSKTAGTDDKVIRDFLEKSYDFVMNTVKEQLKNYNPSAIRRVYIPKSNGKLRPLGIPTILDRIIQECIRIVIEPILEAQFFNHSYGFRPYRETAHAIERIIYVNNRVGYHIAVEGDIKGCFDNMNHRVLIKQLWNMGIKDRRLLTIINSMLKSPIEENGTQKVNTIGLPQGGILSPLLANAYMHKLDMWVSREWECKKLRSVKSVQRPSSALRKAGTIANPEFFIRYADDWVLITDSLKSAEYWKYKITKYLKCVMKLELSQEKTHITNMKKKPIKFLGFKIKSRPIGKGGKFVGYSYPDDDRLADKVKSLRTQMDKVRHASNLDWCIHEINILNSKIRGIINYYSSATGVNESMRKHRENLKYSCYKAVKHWGGKWIPANKCINLKLSYSERTEQVPAVKYNNEWYGIICITFANWQKVACKNQNETPYTPDGVQLYLNRTGKKPLNVRVQELVNGTSYGRYVMNKGSKSLRKRKLYTFEFYMNRCYAFNRDKGKCKVCGDYLQANKVETHHINYNLPNEKINKINNLATLCPICHENIHRKSFEESTSNLKANQLKKLIKYRQIITDIKKGLIIN